MAEEKDDNFLPSLFEHILAISKGECNISDIDIIAQEHDEEKLNILSGLKLLHEDLELYKEEYKKNVDSEYNLKILQQKNKELEQFNFMASHDLKEPLRTVISMTDLIKRDFQILSEDETIEYLNFIADAGKRMFQLIEQLLSFSTAGTKLKKETLDVNSILMNIKKDLKFQLESNNVNLEIDKLPKIFADKVSIQLILQNLISNAIKFYKGNASPQIKISAKSDANKHTFYVADNGDGIDSQYHERIFGLLKRLHTKAEIEGAGIGLSMCRKLVNLHQGKIWIDSEYKDGAKFCFEIPNIKYKTDVTSKTNSET